MKRHRYISNLGEEALFLLDKFGRLAEVSFSGPCWRAGRLDQVILLVRPKSNSEYFYPV